MISLKRCRKVLGPKISVPDETLVKLREQLYCFAELALDIRGQRQKSVNITLEQVATSSEDLDVLQERAAIIEFDGKVTRDEAERMAVSLTLASKLVN